MTEKKIKEPAKNETILGIDVGGSGIKAAVVDVVKGEIVGERLRIETPGDGKPLAMLECIKKLTEAFKWTGKIGCGFPAAIRNGIVCTAANIDSSWIGVEINKIMTETTGCVSLAVNDADAAGLAEIAFGAGKEIKGTVLMITIGTGLGTALFNAGHLLPNTELGHIEIRGKEAEKRASDAARKEKDMTLKKWAEKFDEYLIKMSALFWPEIIILGGGISKKFDRFSHFFNVKTKVAPAKFENDAGIIGAAAFARDNCL